MSGRVTVSLPISDRRRSMSFYRDFLGVDAPGEPAEDGVPEPLEFHLDHGFHLMLVPSGGFAWVVDTAATVAESGSVSALLSLTVSTPREVDEGTGRAGAAGGAVVRAARQELWGYCSLVTDPDGHLWEIVAPSC